MAFNPYYYICKRINLEDNVMKKITCIALMAAALMLATPAKAQFSWGVKGGVSLGNKSLPELKVEGETLSLNNYGGFFIGPKAEVRIPIVGLGVEAAVLFAQRQQEVLSTTLKQSSFQVPLNIKYIIGLGNIANVFVAAGPEFGFNVGNSLEAYTIEKSRLSINAGLGVTLLKHVQVGANYNMPCDETLGIRRGTIQVSVAYLF